MQFRAEKYTVNQMYLQKYSTVFL